MGDGGRRRKGLPTSPLFQNVFLARFPGLVPSFLSFFSLELRPKKKGIYGSKYSTHGEFELVPVWELLEQFKAAIIN